MSEAPKRPRRRRDQQSLAPLLALCLIALVSVVLLGFYLGTLPPEAAPEAAPEPEAERTCATFTCPEMYTKKADAASIAKHTQAECCDLIGANECPSGYDVTGSGTCVESGTSCSEHATNTPVWTLDATSGVLQCDAQCENYASPDDSGICQVRACDANTVMSEDGTCRSENESCTGDDLNRQYTWTGSDLLRCTPGDCKDGFGEDAQQQCQGGDCTYTDLLKITNGVYQWQANTNGEYECMFADACAGEYTYDSDTGMCEAPCGLLMGADNYYNCNSAFSDEDECNACPQCEWCYPGLDYDGWGCYDSRQCP